ncbi:MAG: nuclease [Desulfovibrio sp.]|nr:nuclease [Desulfovibrio sp.]
MKTRISIPALLLILLLAWQQALAAAQVQHPEGIVAYCFDGDTIKLRDRRIVRLAGIDAPETAHKDSPAQYYSRQSRQLLEELARGKTVQLEFPGENIRDRHNRLIANVILPDGQSLNELLVASGAAFFYPHPDLDPAFMEKLRELQAEAIRERRGFWEKLLSLPLADERYVGNRNSLRFFPENCPPARNMKPRNRENFGALIDAFLAGYAPARICVFWPEEKTRAARD